MLHELDNLGDLCERDISACIVLTAPNGAIDPAVLHALKSASADIECVDDALLAFAHIVLGERLDGTRAAWGLRPVGAPAVIVADSCDDDDVDELIDALEQYALDVYLYRGGRSTQRVRQSGRTHATTPQPGPHPFRQAGPDDAVSDAAPADISREEIAMLLSSDPEPRVQGADEGASA